MMKHQKFSNIPIITVLALLILACNLTDNFSGTDNALPSAAEGADPSSPGVRDPAAEPAVVGDEDSQSALAVSPAFDVSARQEVFALLSQSNPAPDLTQLPTEVTNCLANDALFWIEGEPTRVEIYDEYPSGQQREIRCNLLEKVVNFSYENIIIVYDNLSYAEKVEKPQNRRYVIVDEATLPGGEFYFVRSLNDHPLDPQIGVTISTTVGFAAFYDRPECQVFIEDETLLQQVWVPLDFVCKDYLPASEP